MKSTVSIAVIVSTYNSPEYLKRVLNGYLNQSRYPDELIVADDGSTEETARIIKQFAEESPFAVRHVWHEDCGFRLAGIRNRAISAATADYLIFTDGDCIPHPRFIEDHERALNPGCFVTGKRMLVSSTLSLKFVWRGFWNSLVSCLCGDLSGMHHLIRLPWLILPRRAIGGLRGCNLAMFRLDLLAVNGFNEQIVGWGREDSELVARLFRYGLKRLETPFSAIVFHLWHRENTREHLVHNDQLLLQATESGSYFCKTGLVKPDIEPSGPESENQ